MISVLISVVMLLLQVVRLREMFPQGSGFVLVFDYMLSDLAEVVRNSKKPLTEVWFACPLVLIVLVTGSLLCSAGADQELHDNVTKRSGLSSWKVHNAPSMLLNTTAVCIDMYLAYCTSLISSCKRYIIGLYADKQPSTA